MSGFTWRKEPPDSEGVWAWSDDGVNVRGVCARKNGDYHSDAYHWCRIGDVPEIQPAVKSRLPDFTDIGTEVECNCGGDNWVWHKLVGFDGGHVVVWRSDRRDYSRYARARVRCE